MCQNFTFDEAGQKGLKMIKRIISGVQNLNMMRFIMERFTEFSLQIEFLPSFLFL
ncbi:hypothetical protein BM51_0133 [Streptococcus pneumoniae]|nr:hypothetical protein BM50_0123 [Streptococcus pneumoniae]KGI32415.1 hypothetical protein BM51_0133 [Streptococcus pneumoniae]KGI33958.1 hypothetical protein BM48_0121 [Streptococcus pneumoniae]